MKLLITFQFKYLTILLLFSCAACNLSLAQDSNSNTAAQAIVMIKFIDEVGSGLIIGKDADFIYLATAHNSKFATKEHNQAIVVEFHNGKLARDVTVVPITEVNRAFDDDLIFLKVARKKLTFSIEMPILDRIAEEEEAEALQLIGHKSSQKTWRRTSLSQSVDSDTVASLKDSEYAVESTANFSGYLGGGAFDADWRLAGLTTRESNESKDGRVYTIVLKIHRLLERARNVPIPLAPYLLREPSGALELDVRQFVPYTNVLKFRQGSRSYVEFASDWEMGNYRPEVKYRFFVRIGDEWHLWDKFVASDVNLLIRYEYWIPEIAELLAVCNSMILQNGVYAYNAIISGFEGNIYGGGTPKTSVRPDPCMHIFSERNEKLVSQSISPLSTHYKN